MRTLVLALNPSIDAEWRVDEVLWEEKNNVRSERRWAGGKGINVARWLKHLGGEPKLLLPLGGPTGKELAGYLRHEGISAKVIHLAKPTRVNVIVTTNTGRQMRFNPFGPQLTKHEWRAVLRNVQRQMKQPGQGRVRDSVRAAPGLLILSGSLPRGVPVTAYAQLIRLARLQGVRTLLDCDGPALTAAVKARPFLVKPNEHELAQWWGRALGSEAAIRQAAGRLSEQTRGWVLVSRGGKRGFLVNAERFECAAKPPRVKPLNTVGAGDALLAAVARQIQLGEPPEKWLKAGLEVGSRATTCLAGQV